MQGRIAAGDVLQVVTAAAEKEMSAMATLPYVEKLAMAPVAAVCREIRARPKSQAPNGGGGLFAGGLPSDAEAGAAIVRHCEQRAGVDPRVAAVLDRIGSGQGF